jgi:phosphohistidine phosphatase
VDLYLVRHAIAEPRTEGGQDDARRTLTQDGVKLFEAAARGLRTISLQVDGVLASPYARAWSTAEILHSETTWPEPESWRELEPRVEPAACLASLGRRAEGSLALVGHQPQLSRLASLLVSGDADATALELKKGGVVCIRAADGLAPGGGVLRWSASPKMLRRLGR